MWGGGNKGWWVGGRVCGQAGGWAGQNTTTVGVYPGLLNNYLGRKFTQKRREIAPQTPQMAIFRMRRWWVNTLSLIPHLTCARHDDRKTKTTITSRAEYGSRLKSSRLTKCGVPPKKTIPVEVLSAGLVVCTSMMQVTPGRTPGRGYTGQEQRGLGCEGPHVVCVCVKGEGPNIP